MTSARPSHAASACGMLALLLFAIALALAARVIAPSDLYDNDQPKTVAYTADVVLHGRAFLPRDTFGRPPHKPPMYNWLGAPFQAMGLWQEWALKLPAILSGLVTIGLTVVAGRWFLRRGRAGDPTLAAQAPAHVTPLLFGLGAGAIWLANHAGVKLIYLARPDMPMIAFLTAAWLLATWLLHGEVRGRGVGEPGPGEPRKLPRCGAQVGLWLCVTGAALCKGPPALLIVVYIVLGGRLLAGRWSAMWRTGMAWGLPLAALIVAGWLGAAYYIDPRAVVEELLGDQAVGKLHRRGLHRIVTEIYKPVTYLLSRFVPWSIFLVLAMIHVPPRRWFRHPTGPMTLWVLVVVGFFMVPADRRPDYVAPAYPAAAVLAGYWLMIVAAKHGVRPRHVMVAAVVVICVFAGYHMRFSDPARSGLGDHTKAFAAAVEEATGGEGLVFEDAGYNALQPLLGYNQAGPPTPADRQRGRWLIRPVEPGERALLISPPLPGMSDNGADRLGLYRLSRDGASR